MVEIVNVRQMLDVLWKCALTMTAMVKPSAQIEPCQVSKGNEITSEAPDPPCPPEAPDPPWPPEAPDPPWPPEAPDPPWPPEAPDPPWPPEAPDPPWPPKLRALEATCPGYRSPEASRAPTLPPLSMLYGAGRA